MINKVRFYQHWVPTDTHCVYFQLQDGKKVIASIKISIDSMIYISNFYVDKKYRKLGHGKKIFKLAISECLRWKEVNCDLDIMLMTEKENIMIPFYLAKGFKIREFKKGTAGFRDQKQGYVWMILLK